MTTHQVMITDAAIKRHASESVAILHDQLLRPLHFRYHHGRESGSWYLVKSRRWRRIGRWPEVSAALVRKQAPHLLIEGDATLESDQTLGDVLEWFRNRSSQNRAISAERRADIETAISRHLTPRATLCALPVAAIRKADIDACLMLPIQQELKPSTINKVFRVLKQATKMAHSLGVIDQDPMAAFRFSDFIRTTITEKASALRSDDTATVLEQISEHQELQPKAALLASLMLLFGTRINETRLATWRDFDLTAGWWYIPAAHTKTRKALRLPLTRHAIQIILALQTPKPGGAPLFATQSGEPISRQQATQLIRTVSHGKWSAHDLRKLARTIWADIGIDYMISELLLNHTPSKLDRVYIHTYADKKTRQSLEEYHQWLADVSKNSISSVRYALDGKNEPMAESGAVEPPQGNQFTDDRGL